MTFFLEVVIGGLLAGVMYALVALGFVLIYKASGVFNFAQGAMVFFAALTFVSLLERGWNIWLALAVTLAAMVLLPQIGINIFGGILALFFAFLFVTVSSRRSGRNHSYKARASSHRP